MLCYEATKKAYEKGVAYAVKTLKAAAGDQSYISKGT